MPRMKVHQLRYLASVAAEGSIRAAARALGLSQATVTQGLRDLESHAQIALITRHGHGITLTPAGQDLLAHAQRVTAQLREAEATLARHRDTGSAQRLAVGITPWVAQSLLARVVPALRADMPHVQLELFDGLSALALPRLREGSLDLLIGRIGTDDAMQGLQGTPLFSQDMAVVARRGHPRAGARSLAELLDDDWVLNVSASERDALMDSLFVQHGFAPAPQRIHLAHSASLLLTLVQQTDMLTVCPWPLVDGDGLRGGLAPLPLRERFGASVVGIVRRVQETPSPAARRFIALFLEQVQTWVSAAERPQA